MNKYGKIYKENEKVGQFVRFAINGVAATAIQYVVYRLCILSMNEFIANTIAYLVSFTINFFITSYWTFKCPPSVKRFVGFGSSHVINYILQQLGLAFFLWMDVPKEWAILFAMGFAMPINFTILHFIFKK